MSKNELEVRQETMLSLFDKQEVKDTVISLLSSEKAVGAFKQAALAMCVDDKLKKATPDSLLSCALEAASLSLPLRAGQGYVVLYKGKAQLDIGYKGWQVMAKRAGLSVLADPVTSIDDFSMEGFGHNLKIHFIPSPNRELHNDKWLRENIRGIIVSVKEIETGLETVEFVDAGMIFKIMGMSPGLNSSNPEYSPYNNWFLQMLRAKAIKYVLSKSPIDANSSLQHAVEISNTNESYNQSVEDKRQELTDERFQELLPQWKAAFDQGKFTIPQLLGNLNKKTMLNEYQVKIILELDIIDGEQVNAE